MKNWKMKGEFMTKGKRQVIKVRLYMIAEGRAKIEGGQFVTSEGDRLEMIGKEG